MGQVPCSRRSKDGNTRGDRSVCLDGRLGGPSVHDRCSDGDRWRQDSARRLNIKTSWRNLMHMHNRWKSILIVLAAFVCSALPLTAQQKKEITLTIRITGARNANGTVRVLLFRAPVMRIEIGRAHV